MGEEEGRHIESLAWQECGNWGAHKDPGMRGARGGEWGQAHRAPGGRENGGPVYGRWEKWETHRTLFRGELQGVPEIEGDGTVTHRVLVGKEPLVCAVISASKSYEMCNCLMNVHQAGLLWPGFPDC